jgi:hypothetical protein
MPFGRHAYASLWVVLAACGTSFAPRLHATPLVIAEKASTRTTIVVRAAAGAWEARAAKDLAKYIEMMTGASPGIADTTESIEKALGRDDPIILVGEIALRTRPALRKRLEQVAKKNPILRADAIVALRTEKRVYLAGLTDDGHYHAVSHLLHRWGCRWYLPTDFGECIPERDILSIDELDHAYASPFELRSYWLAWRGDNEGRPEFMVRNFMTHGVPGVGMGHAIGKYTRDLVPEGGSIFSVPLAEEKTIEHVAKKIEDVFAKDGIVSLAMEDGIYTSESPVDERLKSGIRDKFFAKDSMSDVFLTLYNGVCQRLLAKYPKSRARIGFLAYSNMTLPPQRVHKAAKPLIASLAPIDIDPIHGMDDPRSPPRQEYREILRRWAEVMEGRVWIYDYDQGMLVWRDIPNPSHPSFRQDIRHYAEAGIIGFHTESRGAIATTFLNLHLRAQLEWNPDLDLDAHLAEFYRDFYGPASEPMARYWNAIYRAWSETICTEHEFFIAPAIYTEELIERLRIDVEEAERKIAPLASETEPTRNEKLFTRRLRFTRLSFDLIDQYMAMVRSATRDCDYGKAVALGETALKTRAKISALGGIFTSTKFENGTAWFPGEVDMYRTLDALVDGSEGRMIRKLPLEWSFRRDPNDTGLARGWAGKPADLTYWKEHESRVTIENRKDYPTTEWEVLRTDLYPQAQGVLHPDWQSFTGYSWYKTAIDLDADEIAGAVHIRFPGLFATAWLYINGELIAHRPQGDLWWLNDYTFSWDVDVSGKLRAGRNDITVRNHNVHHVSGMFRRPFLSRKTK